VVDVDVGEDHWRRRLTFVTRRKHLAFRLVKSVLTRRWFKRVRPAEHGVPCRNQLLEVSLQLVQIGAVVEGLRQWNVSRKVSENRLLLIDGLRLAPVVVNVGLERSRLDV